MNRDDVLKLIETEPDSFRFEHKGFDCLIRRNSIKVYCGYVGIPEGHPFYGLDYSDTVESNIQNEINHDEHGILNIFHNIFLNEEDEKTISLILPAHRGLSYADKIKSEDNDLWYFGFDCGHTGDYVPGLNIGNELKSPAFQAILELFNSMESLLGMDNIEKELENSEYRDFNYVKEKVEILAEHLKKYSL